MKWADMDSDDSDDEIAKMPMQAAGLNDTTVNNVSLIVSLLLCLTIYHYTYHLSF